ncbi:MAG: hypothetical protein BJ554DRAFT_4860 [Olpidium bornovanus]|uniref:Uncharacterized protein n=1 Tax=Olpidium bornovanus TaxID=278681 RepID=A0A8H7ZZU9_9FUNG|nr:MAG: hypothetical protein BJ554DRAFT_4860 [Olpidium bornovanus]
MKIYSLNLCRNDRRPPQQLASEFELSSFGFFQRSRLAGGHQEWAKGGSECEERIEKKKREPPRVQLRSLGGSESDALFKIGRCQWGIGSGRGARRRRRADVVRSSPPKQPLVRSWGRAVVSKPQAH